MENVDRISDLPDSVLSHILSFLPTKSAVQTSILSSRWRYLFALVSNLDIDLLQCDWDNEESLSCFVDRVLSFHNDTHVDKLRLALGRRDENASRVDGWISAALSRGIQHLDLKISLANANFTLLPDASFTCRTLVTLKLDTCFFAVDVPKSLHLPNLKTLHLKHIEFLNDDSIESLLSGCTSLIDMVIDECNMENICNINISHSCLESLTIHHLCNCFDHCSLRIDTPNLAYFKYIKNEVQRYSLENLQSLVKAELDIRHGWFHAEPTPLFRGICNVRSLILSCSSFKFLSSCEPLPVFSTMVELKIFYDLGDLSLKRSNRGGLVTVRWLSWDDYDWTDNVLGTLLSSSPELVKLDFYQRLLASLPEEVPSCLMFKLKEVRISEFEDNEDCIEKAKYFLKNGEALEKLTVHTKEYSRLSEERKLELSEVLMASPRKTKQCCIIVV